MFGINTAGLTLRTKLIAYPFAAYVLLAVALGLLAVLVPVGAIVAYEWLKARCVALVAYVKANRKLLKHRALVILIAPIAPLWIAIVAAWNETPGGYRELRDAWRGEFV